MQHKNLKKAQDLAIEYDRAQANAIGRVGQLMDELSDIRCEMQVARMIFRQEVERIGISFSEQA